MGHQWSSRHRSAESEHLALLCRDGARAEAACALVHVPVIVIVIMIVIVIRGHRMQSEVISGRV